MTIPSGSIPDRKFGLFKMDIEVEAARNHLDQRGWSARAEVFFFLFFPVSCWGAEMAEDF